MLALAVCTLAAQSQQDRKDRIIISYLIAFGDEPRKGELDYWMTDPLSLKNISALVEKHRANMKNDVQLRYRVINNSYLSAFGRYPEPREVEYWKKGSETFTELFASHKKFLTDYREEWKKVVKFSYLQCMNREGRPEEIDYWMKQTAVQTFADIKVHHSSNRKYEPEWNRVDNNKNAVKLIKLSPEAKQETRVLLNNMVPQMAGVISTGGLNVIATGGLNVISTGGLN